MKLSTLERQLRTDERVNMAKTQEVIGIQLKPVVLLVTEFLCAHTSDNVSIIGNEVIIRSSVKALPRSTHTQISSINSQSLSWLKYLNELK